MLMLLQQVQIVKVIATFRLGIHRAPFSINIGKAENLVPVGPFAAALVISFSAVRVPVDMAVILNRLCRLIIYRLRFGRLCSQTAELSQDVRTGSIALLAIDQQRAVLLIDMQVPCFATQGAGSSNMGAFLFGSHKVRTDIVKMQLRTGCPHRLHC